MAITEKLQILITADGRAAQQEFNKLGRSAEQSIGKTDDRLQQLSGQMVSFGAATVVAGGVAATGLYKLAQAAGDLGEAQNKANVILGGEGARALEAFADSAADTAGISKRAALEAGAGFALFVKNAGYAEAEAGDVSARLVQLAGDLGSLNNIGTEEALGAITSALAGESEAIRRLSIDTSDAALKQGIFEKTGEKVTGTLSQQAKTQEIINQLFEQGSFAADDFTNTSDSLANRQKNLAAEFENTAGAIGEALLPTFEALVGGASGVLGAFEGLSPESQKVVGGIAGIATAATLGVGGLALLIGTGMKVADTFSQFRQRVSASEGPLGRLSAASRDAEGNLTALGRAGKGLQFAAGAAGALLLADALYSLTFDAAAAEDALNRLKLLPDDAGTSESLTTLAAFGEEYKSLFDITAGALSDKPVLDADGFGVGLNAIETALENLNKSGNIPELERGLASIREAAALPVNDAISAELIALADRYEGVIGRQKAAAESAAGASGEQAGALDDLSGSTDDAKEASDALKATLTKLSSVQKLANLQFDVGAKRAEAFGDAIERSTNADDLLSSAVGAGRALGDLRETLGLIPAEADAAEKSSDEASKTLERLSDAAKSADPALSDLAISMDGAAAGADAFNKSLASASGFGAQLDAAVDLGEAFDKLDRSARRLPKTIDLTAIALGELRPRQRDAVNDLRDLGSATNDYLTALLKTGATSDEVRNQAAGFRVELEKQLRAAGLSEEAIRQYVEAANLAPEQIETAIKLSGIESARFKLNAYLGLLDGKIPPEVATTIIAAIERDDLNGAAGILRDFAKTNPVAIDFTPEGVDKIDEAKGKLTDLPRVYDPARIAAGEYTTANLNALDSVLGLGDAYKDYLSELAKSDPGKAISEGERLRESFAKTVDGLNLTEDELHSYYGLLGIAPEQVSTALSISIDNAELFALTTTIDLLQNIDELSPEVQLQLSDALLRNDYEEVRRLLQGELQAEFGIDPTIGEETYRKITERWRSEQQNIPVGIDDTEARSDAAALFFDIGRLAPIIKVGIEYAFDAGAATGAAALSGAGRLAGAGVGFGGKLGGGQAPYPGGYDGNPATPYPRAKGGPVGPGRDYLVGEEGPELVTFGAAGTVIPAGPTAQLMQPTSSLGNDKGQAELLAALRDLAAAQAQASGDTVNVYESTSARQTAEEILRVKQANRFLAGRA